MAAREQQTFRKPWNKFRLTGSLVNKICADVKVIESEKNFPSQWDLVEELGIKEIVLKSKEMVGNLKQKVAPSTNNSSTAPIEMDFCEKIEQEKSNSSDVNALESKAIEFKVIDVNAESVANKGQSELRKTGMVGFSLERANDCILALAEFLLNPNSPASVLSHGPISVKEFLHEIDHEGKNQADNN